jgi:hypothetical protein
MLIVFQVLFMVCLSLAVVDGAVVWIRAAARGTCPPGRQGVFRISGWLLIPSALLWINVLLGFAALPRVPLGGLFDLAAFVGGAFGALLLSHALVSSPSKGNETKSPAL